MIALLGVTALVLAGSSLGALTPQLKIATAGGQTLSITVVETTGG